MTPSAINRNMILAYQITTGAGYNPNKSIHLYSYLINYDRQIILPSKVVWLDKITLRRITANTIQVFLT